ncbi:hypothetical protein KG892_05190 [Vermiphilus pyriformis]|nr:MAG: hypothetical protein KG892_05190 [Vermiphilus pyriformis]
MKLKNIFILSVLLTNFLLTPASINTYILTQGIKADLYKIFVQEIGLINIESHALLLSQSNNELKEDIKILYSSFNQDCKPEIQQKLQVFCNKWKLEAIKI